MLRAGNNKAFQGFLRSAVENIAIAWSSIRMNMLRATLTIIIIGFGIMSLISMLTAVDGIKNALYDNFASMGSNSFNISNKSSLERMSRNGIQTKGNRSIRYIEAASFKNKIGTKAMTTISVKASSTAVAQTALAKSSPKISVVGTDENFIPMNGLQLDEGRDILPSDIDDAGKVAVIGYSLKNDLFGGAKATGKIFQLNNHNYLVIGVLQKKGSAFGQSNDDAVIIPVTAAQDQFIVGNVSYDVDVRVKDINQLDAAVDQSTGLMRMIRKLKLNDDNDFYVTKSDSTADSLASTILVVRFFAFAIGLITLLGASVGLTNIMLVSVRERTREIGIRKALGASFINIRNQFLWESIVITQIGGIFGIVIGLGIGNVVARFISGSFVVPWLWIFTGFVLSIIVGVCAGIYPAIKAARLDPIESLRYE